MVYSGGRGRQISEFKASMVYKASPGQPGLCYTEKPCLEKPNAAAAAAAADDDDDDNDGDIVFNL